MSFNIDRSLSWDGLYKIYSNESSFLVKIRETSLGSGLWIVDMVNEYGNTPGISIFSLLKSLSEVCKEYLDIVGGKKMMIKIDNTLQESQKTAKVFTRWLENDWDYKIENSDIKLAGLRNPYLNISTLSILAFRKDKIQNLIPETHSQDPIILSEIKFCFNCGAPNNSFAFCPNCGTKLKQN